MNKNDQKTGASRHTDHGTEVSYIVGFVLSLLFTIIPYNLVRHHSMTTNVLLAAILGIAVVQMIVQVVFFLHLGRERKPRWQLYFFGGTVVGILTVVGGSIFIMANLHHNMSPVDTTAVLSQNEGISQVEGKKTGACQNIGSEHTVSITDGVVSPPSIAAHVCDTLVFVSNDIQPREIAFGPHPTHIPYAGIDELLVSKGHGNMLILSVAGTYHFHDHQDPTVSGTFTVTP